MKSITIWKAIAVDTNYDVFMTHPNDNKLTRISVIAGLTYGAATEITLSSYFYSFLVSIIIVFLRWFI